MSPRYPSTYEIPVLRLLKYLFIIFLFGVAVGLGMAVIAYKTTWWQQLGTATVNFHVANPWFLLIYGGFGLVSLIYIGLRKKQ